MGKRVGRGIALFVLAALLCGCSRLYEGEYQVITEHRETSSSPVSGGWIYEVSTYSGMKDAVQSMVNGAIERSVIRAVEYAGSVSDDISRACLDVTRGSPLGAYAVDYMTHTVTRILSYYEVEVHISYKLTPEEMAAVQSVPTLADLYRLADLAMTEGTERLAVQIVTLAITERTLLTYVENFYRTHPELLVSQPSVSVAFYPSEDHVQKIVSFTFDYHNPRETQREMLEKLNQRADELTEGFDALTPEVAALLCCRAVSHSVAQPARGRTAYSALVDGSAGSEGCAMAFKLLCDRCDIPCVVVSGRLNSQIHDWNIIKLGRAFYHVDVSACIGRTLADGFLKRDSEMWGSYWWDLDEYSSCQGSLTCAEVVEQYLGQPVGGESDAIPRGDRAD